MRETWEVGAVAGHRVEGLATEDEVVAAGDVGGFLITGICQDMVQSSLRCVYGLGAI